MNDKNNRRILKKTLAGILAGVFLFTSTIGWAQEERLSSARTEGIAFSSGLANNRLAPPSKLNGEDFKYSLTVGAICKHVEHDGNLDDKSYLNDVLARLDAEKSSNITVLPYEIIIEIPKEGLAIRYFDPTKAPVITPYSDISKLETKVIGPRINRQIIYRITALVSEDKAVPEEPPYGGVIQTTTTREAIVADPLGIHAKSAIWITKLAATFTRADIAIAKGNLIANAKLRTELLALNAKAGDTVKIIVDGENREKAADAFKNLIEEKDFSVPERIFSQKIENLRHLVELNVPVPPYVEVSWEGRDFESAWDKIERALIALEKNTGKILGSEKDPLIVCVRSCPAVTMPGVLYTETDVNSKEQLKKAIQAVCESWFNHRAEDYRKHYGMPEDKTVKIVIQEMKFGDRNNNSASFILFTHNPITGEKGTLIEYAPRSKGHVLADGLVVPQSKGMTYRNVWHELEDIAQKITSGFYRAQIIEGVIEDNKPYIVQSTGFQPTGLKFSSTTESIEKDDKKFKKTVRGVPASPGVSHARVVYVIEKEALPPPDEGPYILLRDKADADTCEMFLKALDKGNVVGLITFKGGAGSHLATVVRSEALSRKEGFPYVSGISDDCLQMLAWGQTVVLDANQGIIGIMPYRIELDEIDKSVEAAGRLLQEDRYEEAGQRFKLAERAYNILNNRSSGMMLYSKINDCTMKYMLCRNLLNNGEIGKCRDYEVSEYNEFVRERAHRKIQAMAIDTQHAECPEAREALRQSVTNSAEDMGLFLVLVKEGTDITVYAAPSKIIYKDLDFIDDGLDHDDFSKVTGDAHLSGYKEEKAQLEEASSFIRGTLTKAVDSPKGYVKLSEPKDKDAFLSALGREEEISQYEEIMAREIVNIIKFLVKHIHLKKELILSDHLKEVLSKKFGVRIPEKISLDEFQKTFIPPLDGAVTGSAVTGLNSYIDKNKEALQQIFGEEKQDVLVRVPIEAIESMDVNNIKDFLATFQETPNGYVELYYMSGIGEVSEGVYQKYGLQKKALPKGFKRTRENTVTLFAALKGEKLDTADIRLRLGNLELAPEDTILWPIGLQNDPAGLIRATIAGLKTMMIARELKEKGVGLANNQEFRDRIQLEILEQIKTLFDLEDLKNVNLTPYDIIALASGTRSNVINALKKLVRLLPITPIDAEELRRIYEHVKSVITAA